jgi:hypothetical protein
MGGLFYGKNCDHGGAFYASQARSPGKATVRSFTRRGDSRPPGSSIARAPENGDKGRVPRFPYSHGVSQRALQQQGHRAEGTRFRLDRGAGISVARGSRLILGISTRHAGPPCTLLMRSGARLTVHGNAEIFRGTSVLIGDNAHLEMGDKSYINFNSTVTCFDHISVPSSSATRYG